jgi:hypothetical protein
MNDDIHDRFGRALDRVMTGCISDGYMAETGWHGKFLRIGFTGVWYGVFGYGTGCCSSLCVLGMR